MSAALVVSERGSQNRNSSLIASACIHRTYARSCAHWEISVLSSSWMLNGNGDAFSFSITCSRILLEMSVILEMMVSFDKGTASSFFQCSMPQTSSVISRAHGFANVSPILCGFCGKQLYTMLRGMASMSWWIRTLAKSHFSQIEPSCNENIQHYPTHF